MNFWSRSGIVLDQGSEGACVGFSATNFLNVAPKKSKLNNSYALGVYNRARQIDQFPGSTHSGSSVSAGCNVLKERGFISSYTYSQSEDTIESWVKQNGPVMMSHVDLRLQRSKRGEKARPIRVLSPREADEMRAARVEQPRDRTPRNGLVMETSLV